MFCLCCEYENEVVPSPKVCLFLNINMSYQAWWGSGTESGFAIVYLLIWCANQSLQNKCFPFLKWHFWSANANNVHWFMFTHGLTEPFISRILYVLCMLYVCVILWMLCQKWRNKTVKSESILSICPINTTLMCDHYVFAISPLTEKVNRLHLKHGGLWYTPRRPFIPIKPLISGNN